MLRGINGWKRDEIIDLWRKLRNEELHNFYFSPNIISNDEVNDEMDRKCNTDEKRN
jgi:hypothetical protein